MRSTSDLKRTLLVLSLLIPVFCPSGSDQAFAQETSAGDVIPFQIKPPFAWNRTDRYVPPDFQKFFPDDKAAGKQLDQMLDGKLKIKNLDERLALMRRGLRNCTEYRTILLGQVGNSYIWDRKPQDPRAIELMYHASASEDADIAHYALYHGPTVVSDRSANLVRMLMERYPTLDAQMQERIAWGMRIYGEKEQTRQLLEDLLDDHQQLSDLTVGSTVDTYRAVFETDPPELNRFDDAGLWVIAYHRTDVSTTHPRSAEILREMVLKPLRGQEAAVRAFVTRVDDGHETAVVLLQGLKPRRLVEESLSRRIHTDIDFNELFSARVLMERRINEFVPYLPAAARKHRLPAYTRPPEEATYAYQAEEFVAPDYLSFFADDPEAGKQLDEVYAQRDNLTLSDQELLELFRKGVRRSSHSPNTMFSWIAGSLGWPRDPRLTEILYQGLDPAGPVEVRKAALYYGFGLGTEKTKNILQALFRVYMAPPFDNISNTNMRPRILWSVRDHADDQYYLSTLFAQALRNHEKLSDVALQQADLAYQQLAGADPPNAAEYASRGVYLVVLGVRSAKTKADAERKVSQRLGESPYLLKTKSQEKQGEVSVLVLVKGKTGLNWLMEKLKDQPKLRIYFAELLTRELIEKDEDLEEFRKYLPAQQPTKQ